MLIVLDMQRTQPGVGYWSHAAMLMPAKSQLLKLQGGGIIKSGMSTCRNLVQTTSFVSQDVCVGLER